MVLALNITFLSLYSVIGGDQLDMPLAKEEKDKIIKKFKTHEADTGSSEVQIALLTAEIEQLTGHLKTHKKDFSSRRGLLKKVGQRHRLLRFLQRDNPETFGDLVKKLKLKVAE